MTGPDEKFHQIINKEWHVNPTEPIQENPYGTPTTSQKAGLTKRGKVALAVATAAVAGTGFFWYQDHSVQVAKDTKEAAALEIQVKQLELEKLKEINKATTAQKKNQATEDAARQKFVDACVEADQALVGKQMGVTYSSVVADCRDQFQGDERASVDGADMAVAGSADDSGSGGVGINQGLLIGGGVLAAFLVYAAKRGTRPDPA